jgi:hypothetical protein
VAEHHGETEPLPLSILILGLTAVAALPAFAASAASGDFRGAVEFDGRKVHLECKGDGGPAVILISGYRNNGEIWAVAPGPGIMAVFSGVAGFTRVCAYDRPGTILDADHLSRSDPVPIRRAEFAQTSFEKKLPRLPHRPCRDAARVSIRLEEFPRAHHHHRSAAHAVHEGNVAGASRAPPSRSVAVPGQRL